MRKSLYAESMELTPLLIYESFVLIMGVAAVLAFAAFYFRLLQGYNALRKEYLELETKAKQETQEVLEKTHADAVSIIKESRVLSEEMKKKLTAILEQSAQKESKEYEQMIDQVGEDIKRESLARVDQFARNLEQETRESQTELAQKQQQAEAQAHTEIEAYKAHQLQVIDSKIYAIVSDVVKQTTGKLLTREDHDGIVIHELEEAKKAHVL